LISLIAICILAESAHADYQSGLNAYMEGDYDRALMEWQKVVESPPAVVHPYERAETYYAVAMLFWMGQGVEQDTSTAAGFLRQAAELNHAGAQSKLGYLFLIGQGVPASTYEARKWLDMAAMQGDPDAQYNLAVMYRDGIGVESDPALAMQWFREAAANGDPVSAEVVAEYARQGNLQALTEPPETAATAGVVDEPVADAQPPDEAVVEQIPVPGTHPASRQEIPGAGSDTAVAVLEQALDENWILSRDPEHYTIQVIALKNLQSMINLVDDHPEMLPFAVYRQGSKEAPLHVLIQGDYVDIEAVRVVQQSFPASLAKPNQLWVRRFGMVQELIENRQMELNQSTGTNRVPD